MLKIGVALALSALAIAGPSAAAAQTPAGMGASYTVEPFTPPAAITIQGTGVRLRAEPFTSQQTQVLSSGSTGLALVVVGLARQPDWTWYQVVLRNGQKAFIRSDLTSAPMRGGGASLAPALPPPTPLFLPPAPALGAALAPAPRPPSYEPPAQAYQAPAYQPPAYQAPAYQPPRPVTVQSGRPAGPDNAPISLTPTSPVPATPDPSGLRSNPSEH